MTNPNDIVQSKHLDSLAAALAGRNRVVNFSLSVSDWALSAAETSDYAYVANIAVSGLTAYDYAFVDIARAAQGIAADCNLCPSAESLHDYLRLFAKDIPSDSLTGQITVLKGASQNALQS